MIYGILLLMLLQFIILYKINKRSNRHAEHLRKDKKRLEILTDRIESAIVNGNSSCYHIKAVLNSNKNERLYLEDKIDSLLELLNQEYKESVK